MLVVFLGVLAAFFVDDYRESIESKARAARILEAIQTELQSQLDWFAPWYKANESRRSSWMFERQENKEVPPFYIRIPGAAGYPMTTWNAALATDALRVIEPQLIRKIASFYHESNGMSAHWDRYLEHTDRFVLPAHWSDPSEYLDPETDQYNPEIQVNLQLMNDVFFESYDKFFAWPNWMNGEIQDYLNQLNGDETPSLFCAVSASTAIAKLTMAEEMNYSDIDWQVDLIVEMSPNKYEDSTNSGFCWIIDADNKKPCRLAMYFENLAMKSELLDAKTQPFEQLRARRDESGCSLIFGSVES